MGRISWNTVAKHKRNPISTHLGTKMLAIRQETMWTQSEAAKQCDISTTSYCDLENGRNVPSVTTLLRLSKGFGVEVSYWFSDFDLGQNF